MSGTAPTTSARTTGRITDPEGVKDALTVNRAAGPARKGRPSGRQRRRRTPVENTDYAAFAARVIRAHGRRVAEGDVKGLAELLDLAREIDAAT